MYRVPLWYTSYLPLLYFWDAGNRMLFLLARMQLFLWFYNGWRRMKNLSMLWAGSLQPPIAFQAASLALYTHIFGLQISGKNTSVYYHIYIYILAYFLEELKAIGSCKGPKSEPIKGWLSAYVLLFGFLVAARRSYVSLQTVSLDIMFSSLPQLERRSGFLLLSTAVCRHFGGRNVLSHVWVGG